MPASNNTFGLTQMEIANRSGLHQSHISKYLAGKSMPTLINIERISDACGLSIETVSQHLLNAYKMRRAG
jgi:transcriptional regulator with XRE-family HTH domain